MSFRPKSMIAALVAAAASLFASSPDAKKTIEHFEMPDPNINGTRRGGFRQVRRGKSSRHRVSKGRKDPKDFGCRPIPRHRIATAPFKHNPEHGRFGKVQSDGKRIPPGMHYEDGKLVTNLFNKSRRSLNALQKMEQDAYLDEADDTEFALRA